ncbi:MAG: glucose-1-phosphate thymidylyltransferase [Candidatus Bathyarchaeota archaeon]|nr:MAG: glucose-1-phosphate thymidylyltransferase [Candidatus Bathyarchaeota archaeon]
MKAIILAAGRGTRMFPLTYTRPKHMLPVAGKPMLEHIVDFLRSADVVDLSIVVRHMKEHIQDYFSDGSRFNVKIQYIEQTPGNLGLAHAVKCASSVVKDEDDFIVILGDVLIELDFRQMLEQHKSKKARATIALATVEDPRPFGVVTLNEDLEIRQLVEKPRVPASNQVITGLYIFNHDILEIIDNLKPSWRGEFELTDAMQKMVEKEGSVYGFPATNWWKDTGRPTDLLDANKKFLSELPSFFMLGEVQKGAELRGTIQIDRNTVVQEDAEIVGPVVIGKDCQIGPGCKIGPYVEIGDKVQLVENVLLKNSIVMNNSIISNETTIYDSIIGEDCQIGPNCTARGNNTNFGIVVGDHSTVGPHIHFNPNNTLGPHSRFETKL